MTNMEAYNAMIDGFAVSHKDFSPDQFLYMDDNHIIRDENGYEFESSWDVKVQMERFKTDWYLCKNRTDIEKRIADIGKITNGIGYIEDEKYQQAIEVEPIENKIAKTLAIDENGNQVEFSDQDGFLIESATNSYDNGCRFYSWCVLDKSSKCLNCKYKKRIDFCDRLRNIMAIINCIMLVVMNILLYTEIITSRIFTCILMTYAMLYIMIMVIATIVVGRSRSIIGGKLT